MFDIHQSLFDDDGVNDERLTGDYIDDLITEFVDSPEAKLVFDQYDDRGYSNLMLEYAIDHLGLMPSEMSLSDFNEIVFDLFPRNVSTSAESAPAIVAELRAFWTFLHRRYGLANAPPIIASLTNAAAKRLEKELSNPANFGTAKSFFMRGEQAGFDMTTQEGLDAFMITYNSSLAGGAPEMIEDFPPEHSLSELPPSPLSPKQRAEKRKKRKAQRQAKKRNRR